MYLTPRRPELNTEFRSDVFTVLHIPLLHLLLAADGSLPPSCFRLNTKVLSPIGSLASQVIMSPEDDIAPKDNMSLARSRAL